MESAQQDTGGANRSRRREHALKLLANEQKDGDSPIQSVVTNCTKEVEETSWTGQEASAPTS